MLALLVVLPVTLLLSLKLPEALAYSEPLAALLATLQATLPELEPPKLEKESTLATLVDGEPGFRSSVLASIGIKVLDCKFPGEPISKIWLLPPPLVIGSKLFSDGINSERGGSGLPALS